MSASLVGSEMCIRDSPPSYSSKLNILLRRADSLAREAPTALPAGRNPVSYTHLTLPTICSV
eukprot:170747-Alexandrium_andersonii.AAC.1